MNLIKTFNPELLLGDRLELTIYGMFVEAYIKNALGVEKEIYERFISNFPGEKNNHTPENFIKLIKIIMSNGFDPRNPVLANPCEYSLLNGSHRCSIAIQLGIKEVPYVLRVYDDHVSDRLFKKYLGPDFYNLIQNKRREYIERSELINRLKCEIRMYMRQNYNSFQAPFSSLTKIPSLRTYQSFEKLGINGKRPAELRSKVYGASDILTNNMDVLEVGCNVGFFSLVISGLVNTVTALDIDEHYIELAEKVRVYCNINNCTFKVCSIQDFKEEKQFDVVISTAIHGWTGMDFGSYIKKIAGFVKHDSLIFFESHELDAELDWGLKREFIAQNFDILKSGIIDDVDTSMYESEYREYLIFRKRKSIDYSNLNYNSPKIRHNDTKNEISWGREFFISSSRVATSLRNLSSDIVSLGKKTLPPSVRYFLKRHARLYFK